MPRHTGKPTRRAGSVRIIGGDWRRRQIAIPVGGDLRPTPDRVRETLFNWLDPVISGAACLDLFAGTGVLGFEALSRGAMSAVFVERDMQAVAALERLQEELGANATVQRENALAYIARFDRLEFDIVFVDPPFAVAVEPIMEQLLARLRPQSLIYLERDRNSVWPVSAGLAWSRRSTAGAVAFGLGTVQARDGM